MGRLVVHCVDLISGRNLLINGTAGVVITLDGEPHVLMAFTIVHDQVVEVDVIADPERVRRVASGLVGDG